MKFRYPLIIAVILAASCAIALHAQDITRTAFPFPGCAITATLVGRQNGVLVHGSADTMYCAQSAPDCGKLESLVFPFVFECDSNGAIGTVHIIPDTGRSESWLFVGNTVEMKTAAVRDGAGRIMVAWSAQNMGCDDAWIRALQEPLLSLGVFENDVFRLIAPYPGGSNPLLLPSVLAFAADRHGVARAVLRQRLCRNEDAITGRDAVLALSSEGVSSMIPSTEGRNIGAISCTIDEDGRILCAFSAYGLRPFPLCPYDSLFVCSIDPALSSASIELLAADTVSFGDLQFLRTNRDGACLSYTQGDSAWLTAGVGTGSRRTQSLADGFGWLMNDAAGAVDSAGALWIAFRQSTGPDYSSALLRIPRGSVIGGRNVAPDELSLQCFPNPASKDATLRFTLPSEQSATITVHDLLGREVLRVADGHFFAPGTYTQTVNLEGLPAGVYGISLSTAKSAVWTTISVR